MPQQPQPRHRWDQRNGAFGRGLHLRELPALGIAVEAVDVGAEHQAALVRLGDVEELGAKGDHVVDEGLDRLAHEGLQQVAFDRQAQPGKRGQVRGVPGDGDRRAARGDRAAAGGDAGDPVAGALGTL